MTLNILNDCSIKEKKYFGLEYFWQLKVFQSQKKKEKISVQILPESIYHDETNIRPLYRYRAPYLLTALIWSQKRKGMLLRRGYFSPHENGKERELEDILASHILSGSLSEDNNEKPYVYIILFQYPKSTVNNDFEIFERYLAIKYDASLIQSFITESKIDSINLKLNRSLCSYRDLISHTILCCIKWAGYIYNGNHLILEDNYLFQSNYIFCSLIKILIDNRYCAHEGFYNLIVCDWINFGYNILSGATYGNIFKNYVDLSIFNTFILCVKYMIFAFPANFTLKMQDIDSIVWEIRNKIYTKQYQNCSDENSVRTLIDKNNVKNSTELGNKSIYEACLDLLQLHHTEKDAQIMSSIFEPMKFQLFCKEFCNNL